MGFSTRLQAAVLGGLVVCAAPGAAQEMISAGSVEELAAPAADVRIDRARTGASTVAPGTPRAIRATIHGEDIVRTSRRLLGIPYRWGGSGTKAFDCSGFVQYVYSQHGIRLPRTAREQAAVGEAPYPGDLQPGDILFFYGGNGVQHNAIYVGGDTIIHASSAGGRVQYDVLRRGPKRLWFRQRLIAVRRVLPAQGVFYLPQIGAPARPEEFPVAVEGRGS